MNKAIIGLQWGDEGKGKIVDYLSENFDLVVRYQGGNNAGHTVIVDDSIYKLNLIPSGAIRGKVCFLGQGVILDLDHFFEELRRFKEKIPDPTIYLSSNISLILDYHKKLDKINESILVGNSKIGTTAKGIGPAYQDKVGRKSIKLSDLSNKDILDSKLHNIKSFYDPILLAFSENPINITDYKNSLSEKYETLKSLIVDNNFINNNFGSKKILFEGAQGALLDLDYGSYPFVTSSNTISSYIPIGSGINKNYETLGIFKAYATRVGNGPFPSELNNDIGDYLGEKGFEFGTVTKRKRRCGWLDLVALKYSCVANDTKELCITKVDVLNDLDDIKICKSYNGKLFNEVNFASSSLLENLTLDENDFEKFHKWGNLSGLDSYESIPAALKVFIEYIENYLGIPINIISFGPERNETIIK
ncbi:adenylosuccinate synthase [Alphaproteobacteria bacterium]|nr:adenylosuccinate synthase [Alphaproteobacteria bacterium]